MISSTLLDKTLSEWKTRMMSEPSMGFVTRDLGFAAGLRPELATVISGPRRAGKSTLLGQLPGLMSLSPERCWFCNFEDPNLVLVLGTELLDAIVAFALEHTAQGERTYFFFDEIQNVPGWEKWLHKALTGNSRNIFVLTGSNASMLSGELATALTGRFRAYELFPFSYSEFRTVRAGADLLEYLNTGGFPLAVSDPDAGGYLQELFRNVVLRDIAPKVRARSTTGLLQVVSSVYQSVGSELSLRRLGQSLGLATDTVGQYLEACEQAYLLFSCPFFSYSERQSAHRGRKYYAVDTGLRSAVAATAGRDRGKALENFVFLALRRRQLPVSYWRDGGEVDFVVRSKERITPIQVSWDGPTERHEKALDAFYARHPQAAEALLVDASNAADFASTFTG